jgi:hypothetical protein
MEFLRLFLSPGGITEKEHRRLLPYAEDLALFILEDPIQARDVASKALERLAEQRASIPRERILQALVFEFCLRQEQGESYDDLLRYYLKFIVHLGLLRTSFDSCIAVGTFVYDYKVVQALDLYGDLTQRRVTRKHASDASTKRRMIFEDILERFRGRVQEDTSRTPVTVRKAGEKTRTNRTYHFVRDRQVDGARVKQCLNALAPWRLPLGKPATRADLAAEWQPRTEVQRIRSAFLPAIHEHFFKTHLRRKPGFRIPRFTGTVTGTINRGGHDAGGH